MDALRVALEYQHAGLAPIPVPYASKTPVIRWRQWQDRAPSPSDVQAMFGSEPSNIAVVCGRASGNLLVLDADSPATFADIGNRLASMGIATWTVQRPANGSSHDGGGHYWVRAPEPAKSFKVDGVDGQGQGSIVLAPPSAHPDGGLYEFITKPNEVFTLPSLDTLDWLKLEPAAVYRERSRLAKKLLAGDETTVTRYRSRSEAEAALCASLACSGFSYADALRLMCHFPGPGKFTEMYAEDPDNARRYLHLTWCKAAEFVATHEGDAIQLARNGSQWAESRPWPGRTGATDHATYCAHLSIVEKCGRQPYAASCRDLAELAGVSWDTAAKATRRLRDTGLIELVQDATAIFAHRYQLLEPPLPNSTPTSPSSDTPSHGGSDRVSGKGHFGGGGELEASLVMECKTKVTLGHDAFRWKGLAKTGLEVLAALQAREQATVREITEATGRHQNTVRRKLKAMAELSLVERVDTYVWRFIGGDLDEVAEELGTAGVGQRERWQHEHDRQDRRLALAEGDSRACFRRGRVPMLKVKEETGEIL